MKRPFRFVPSLALALLMGALAGPALAQSAGAFARMGFGARGIAMGNALVADAAGDVSPYYNPALAPFATGQSLEASAALLGLDRQLQFLQFATPLKPRAGIAVGLTHAGVSKIDGRDESGYHTEDYATDEFAFFLAFGTRIGERVSLGLGLQLFRADYFEDLTPVNSIGIDVGLTVRVTEALRVGFAADDLLARYSWDTSAIYGADGKTTSDRFPTRLRLGGAYTLFDGKARLVAEYESSVSPREARTRTVDVVGDQPREVVEATPYKLHDARLRVGGEYRYNDLLALRAGVDRLGDAFSAAVPSAGFMIEQPVGTLRMRAEYAFRMEPYALGAQHFLSLRLFL